MKPIAIASDHGGYRLKENVKIFLTEVGTPYEDYGTGSEEICDYPDYAAPASRAVSMGRSVRAILCCGSGTGMSIVANKFPGVRAVNCYDEWSTLMSRRHNDANIMTIGERCMEPDDARRLIQLWLDTPFEEGRHARRISKISDLEQKPYSSI